MNAVLIILGVILLMIGVFAGAYSTNQSQVFGLLTTTATPYAQFSIPLIIGGIVLIIVGLFSGGKKKES